VVSPPWSSILPRKKNHNVSAHNLNPHITTNITLAGAPKRRKKGNKLVRNYKPPARLVTPLDVASPPSRHTISSLGCEQQANDRGRAVQLWAVGVPDRVEGGEVQGLRVGPRTPLLYLILQGLQEVRQESSLIGLWLV
jgi:hypothetical protein